MNILKKIRIEDINVAIKYVLALIIEKLVTIKIPKNIWLISERGDEARDNAYHLYKYIREEHPNINCFYLIKKRSSDYQKIKRYKNVIEYGSMKHYVYYIASKVCISTHIYRYIPDYRVTQRLDEVFKLNKIRVFLQHGIIQSYHPYLSAKKNPLNLFCCGGVRECEYIKESLGYSDDIAICTGLARYDALQEFHTKKQILLMPTWRGDLYMLTESEFIKSDYFQAMQFIINSNVLIPKMKERGYELIFYPHYEMQKYIHLFKTEYDNVKIAKHECYDVQQLLKESEILITDYSSIFFDFAYMKKPIIYYQFDKETYNERHYQKGYFDYDKDGFGEITNQDEIIEKILAYINTPIMPKKYKDRVDEFFGLRDRRKSEKNCERIFKIIERKIGNYE